MKILFFYSMFIILQSSLSQAKDITVQGRVCNRDQIGIPLAEVSFISQDLQDTVSTIIEKNIVLTGIEEYYSKLIYSGEYSKLVYVPEYRLGPEALTNIDY